MATKWKSISKKWKSLVLASLTFVWAACLVVLLFMVWKNQMTSNNRFAQQLAGVSYLESETFENTVCDAIKAMDQIYSDDLCNQLYDQEIDNLDTTPAVVWMKYNFEWKDKKHTYQSGFTKINSNEYDWNEQLLPELFSNVSPFSFQISHSDIMSEWVMMRFGNVAELGKQEIWDYVDKPGIWMGYEEGADAEIVVYNHTGQSDERLRERLAQVFGADAEDSLDWGNNSWVLGMDEEQWNAASGSWIRGCWLLRILLTVFVVSFLSWLVFFSYLKKNGEISLQLAFFDRVKHVVQQAFRTYVLGFLLGEIWYAKGYVWTQTMRTAVAAAILAVCGITTGCSMYWLWDWAYVDVIFTICGVLFAATILFYGLGEFQINRRYKELQSCIARIQSGDFSVEQVPERTPYVQDLSSLSDIRAGLEKNLETRIRAERTKIELVTNVSHDLKTPLTSIISYIDLLERMEDLPEEAREYVRILDKKSARLKAIVADVFELAKTTSGEIKLNIQKLNVNKLLNQTLGVLEDRIANSGLQIKTQFSEEELYIDCDGQRLYRVLQNLVDNALKYSLKGTRVYIQEQKVQERVEIVIKNTANYEMDFTAEDVIERFFCGDKSRNTEGNGLGLSIAQGFTVACGGEFQVRIDGDQFNVKLSFPISEKMEEEDAEDI